MKIHYLEKSFRLNLINSLSRIMNPRTNLLGERPSRVVLITTLTKSTEITNSTPLPSSEKNKTLTQISFTFSCMT